MGHSHSLPTVPSAMPVSRAPGEPSLIPVFPFYVLFCSSLVFLVLWQAEVSMTVTWPVLFRFVFDRHDVSLPAYRLLPSNVSSQAVETVLFDSDLKALTTPIPSDLGGYVSIVERWKAFPAFSIVRREKCVTTWVSVSHDRWEWWTGYSVDGEQANWGQAPSPGLPSLIPLPGVVALSICPTPVACLQWVRWLSSLCQAPIYVWCSYVSVDVLLQLIIQHLYMEGGWEEPQGSDQTNPIALCMCVMILLLIYSRLLLRRDSSQAWKYSRYYSVKLP